MIQRTELLRAELGFTGFRNIISETVYLDEEGEVSAVLI